LKENNEKNTLYVVKTIKGNSGVDMYCVLQNNNEVCLFAV